MRAVDVTGRERHDAAGSADVKDRGFMSEAIWRDVRRIAKLHFEAAVRMRGPYTTVFRTEFTTAGAHRYPRAFARPFEAVADVAAVALPVDESHRSGSRAEVASMIPVSRDLMQTDG